MTIAGHHGVWFAIDWLTNDDVFWDILRLASRVEKEDSGIEVAIHGYWRNLSQAKPY